MRPPDFRPWAITAALMVLASASHALPRCPPQAAASLGTSPPSADAVAAALASAIAAAMKPPTSETSSIALRGYSGRIGSDRGSPGPWAPPSEFPLVLGDAAGTRGPFGTGVTRQVWPDRSEWTTGARPSTAAPPYEPGRVAERLRGVAALEPWLTARVSSDENQWFRVLGSRTIKDSIWVQTPIGLKKKIGDAGCTNCQTGGGTAVPEGGLGGAPGGELVAGGRMPDGAPCWRPAEDVDWRIDATHNTTNLLYDPTGFREVGVLAFKSGGIEIVKHCTFVRVSPTYIVTAAHCVAASDRREGKVLASEPLMNGLLALIPSDAAAQANTPRSRDLMRCWTHANDCGYHVGFPQGEVVFHPDVAWADAKGIGAAFPVPDLAVVKVRFPADTPSRFARLPSEPSVPGLITTLGFGLTDRREIADDGNPIVGWSHHDGPTALDGGLVYIAPTKGRRTRSCFGDSGGAVYGHGQNGSPNEAPRELIAIVSGAQGMAQGLPPVDQCLNAPLGRAQTLAPLRAWLCEATRQEALGCS